MVGAVGGSPLPGEDVVGLAVVAPGQGDVFERNEAMTAVLSADELVNPFAGLLEIHNNSGRTE